MQAGLRGLTNDDRQVGLRWKRGEGFPVDVFGQDGSENALAGLVRSNGTLLCFHVRASDCSRQHWQRPDDESIGRRYRSVPKYWLDVAVKGEIRGHDVCCRSTEGVEGEMTSVL